VRLLLAPDKFAGTLTASEAAEAVAEGWRRVAPDDTLDLAPLSDGGPGFVDVVHAARGGDLVPVTVTGPLGDPVPAVVLLEGETAYVETAQACGLHLVPEHRRDPVRTSTRGVGELLAAAVDAGARRVVLGLGGSATNDGGAGMLAALGAVLDPHPADAVALGELQRVDVGPARARVEGCTLVVASDVDSPLLGIQGASAVFGPQKGADPDRVVRLDAALARWAAVTGGDPEAAGAGAAGGLGYGLALLGTSRVPGIETVLDLVGLPSRVAGSDLVITGEGALDASSLRGKVVAGVAAVASSRARPCLVLAGRVEAGRRELGAAGVTAAYGVADGLDDPALALDRPDRRLADLAASVAREWSR
jgi:glycerate 2-kinase